MEDFKKKVRQSLARGLWVVFFLFTKAEKKVRY
jgi:hypothetical protein